jgi:L-lactate dehydrogenase (cytochrome)
MSALDRCHNIDDLRAAARRRLPAPMFHYIDGAADDEFTLRRNTSAFDDYVLVPRYLVDVSRIETDTQVLGAPSRLPLVLAPTGMSRLFHRDGERAVARAAAAAGIPYSLSTVGTCSIEEVAAANGGTKLFQLYILRDRALNAEFMARARESGFHALCLTVDVPVAGNRERDLRTGMSLPPRFGPRGVLDVLRSPAWLWDFLRSPPIELANVAHRAGIAGGATTLARYISEQFDPTVTWDDAARMIDDWGGPFAVKGILSADDARRAVDAGASAVIVSNHGGRQLDGAPGALDCLQEVLDAVGDRVEVILDGGVRRGTHVLKALALGARACMIGRPYLYGLGAGGEAGVRRALGLLAAELVRDMALLGCTRVSEIGPGHVRRRV